MCIVAGNGKSSGGSGAVTTSQGDFGVVGVVLFGCFKEYGWV